MDDSNPEQGPKFLLPPQVAIVIEANGLYAQYRQQYQSTLAEKSGLRLRDEVSYLGFTSEKQACVLKSIGCDEILVNAMGFMSMDGSPDDPGINGDILEVHLSLFKVGNPYHIPNGDGDAKDNGYMLLLSPEMPPALAHHSVTGSGKLTAEIFSRAKKYSLNDEDCLEVMRVISSLTPIVDLDVNDPGDYMQAA